MKRAALIPFLAVAMQAQTAQRVEGFASVIFAHNNHPAATVQNATDFRGPARAHMSASWWASGQLSGNRLEWNTAAAPAKEKTTFVFIGASSPLPTNIARGPEAKLYVNDEYAVTFTIGWMRDYAWNKSGYSLRYRSVRNEWPSWGRQRQFELEGNSGFYELTVPAEKITAGQPVRIKVELQPFPRWPNGWFMVKDRTDATVESPQQLRQEVTQLRKDVNRLSELVHVLLTRDDNPGFQHFSIYSNGLRHVHPADIVPLNNGAMLLTTREATEHIAVDGDMVILHSTDGRTWTKRARIGVPNLDEREATGFQFPDGEIIMAVYYNRLYRKDGEYEQKWAEMVPFGKGTQHLGFYIVRSKDEGLTWSKPDFIPIQGMPFTDTEGPADAPILMPDGSILMPVIGYNVRGDLTNHSAVILRSTDRGRNWQHYSTIADDPGGRLGHFQEPGLLRMKSGHLLAAMRNNSGQVWTSKSRDGGKTWSTPQRTPMTGHPADLVQLPDGRVLCTYGLRDAVHTSPGGIRATFSSDEGETWDIANEVQLRNDLLNWDIGYPETVVLPGNRLLTVYYMNAVGKYSIAGTIWKP